MPTRLSPLVLVCVLAAQVAAQGKPAIDGYTYLPTPSLGRLAPGDVSKKYYVEARWQECWKDSITLCREPEARKSLVVTFPSDLQTNLARDQDSAGQKLTAGVSNVRLRGTVERGGDRPVLRVDKVELLEDDLTRLRARLAALGEKATPEQLSQLANEVRPLAERYGDQRLVAFAGELSQREIAARLAGRDPNDFEGALRIGAELQKTDRRGAITIYGDVEARAPEALRKEARQRLAQLRAYRAASGWVPYEEFKASEGFVRRGEGAEERWISRERAEFEATVAAEMAKRDGPDGGNVIVLRSNPAVAGKKAEARQLEIGQTLEEARLATAGIAQTMVDHHLHTDSTAQQLLWTQWVLADGRRLYFLAPNTVGANGAPASAELAVIKLSRDPLPDK
jgi:hypothetical protein